ncbi:MAG: MFS transporter, partial [Pseudanabaena sp.]
MKNWNGQSDRISNIIYHYLPAMRWQNFRLFFGGQLLSMSGTFMTQQLTIPWLVYDLTKSAWMLGIAGFVQFLPTLIVIPFSGVLSDRWSRRDLLMFVQIVGIAVSLALTILTFTNLITFPILLVLSVLNGMIKGLDMPVRHTIVTETVGDRADSSNAIALNSVMLSSSLVLGPAVGGILVATLGVKYCFLYDTISYIPAILTLQAMRLPAIHANIRTSLGETFQKLREGFVYVSQTQPIRAILLMIALKGLVGMAHIALMPVFAAEILNGNA